MGGREGFNIICFWAFAKVLREREGEKEMGSGFDLIVIFVSIHQMLD